MAETCATYVHLAIDREIVHVHSERYPFPVHEDAKVEIGHEYVNGNEYEESTVNRVNEVSSLIITYTKCFLIHRFLLISMTVSGGTGVSLSAASL